MKLTYFIYTYLYFIAGTRALGRYTGEYMYYNTSMPSSPTKSPRLLSIGPLVAQWCSENFKCKISQNSSHQKKKSEKHWVHHIVNKREDNYFVFRDPMY